MILVKYSRKEDLKPYFYFALEEYILEKLLKENEVFFFLWQKIKGIVIGKNQIIENEISLDFVKKNKIDIFRRPTGGGCVFNDTKTIVFSIITKKNKEFSFKKYLSGIIDAFKNLGVELYFSGRNDILLNEKKVSGNAFMQKKDGIILHGTLLYDLDINTMVRCVTVPNEKLISKGIKSVFSRVTNLKEYLKDMTKEKLSLYLENFLTNSTYILSKEEIEKIEKNSKKFSSKEWIFHEYPSYSKVLKKHFDWGNVEIFLSLKKGKIEKIDLKGDFFHKEEKKLQFFLSHFKNINFNKEQLRKIKNIIKIEDYIFNAKNEEFFSFLEENTLY
jgi:lipoate-protein ligase A